MPRHSIDRTESRMAPTLTPGERWITDPRLHGEQLHRGGLGCVAIAQKTTRGSWKETVYPVEVAIELVNHYRGREHGPDFQSVRAKGASPVRGAAGSLLGFLSWFGYRARVGSGL